MTEEEKEMRKFKIEANRKGKDVGSRERMSCHKDVTFQLETNGSDTNLAYFDDSDETLSIDDDNLTSIMEIEELISGTPTTVDQVTETLDTTNQCWSLSPVASSMEQSLMHFDTLTARSREMDEEEISNSTYHKAVELELSVIPIPKPVRGCVQLNEIEFNRIYEIFSLGLTFRKPYPPNQIVYGKAEDLANFFSERFELFSSKLVTVSKTFDAFNELCQNDPIALIKSSILEIMYMRSVQHFDSANEQWTFSWVNIRNTLNQASTIQ